MKYFDYQAHVLYTIHYTSSWRHWLGIQIVLSHNLLLDMIIFNKTTRHECLIDDGIELTSSSTSKGQCAWGHGENIKQERTL